MTGTEPLTGALPDRAASRDRDRSEYNFANTTGVHVATYASAIAFVQPMAWVRDQPVFPDCVGESKAAFIDSRLPGPPWASGVSIWRDARRRQGKIEQIDIGTRIEYAVDSLVERGWDPYRAGEETDDVEAGKGAAAAGDDLDDELFAHDTRLPEGLARYRIIGFGSSVLDAVDEALRRDFGVIIGTFLTDAFLSHRRTPDQPDVVLGKEYFAGFRNSHAMRLRGRAIFGGRRAYLIQNSHGPSFGGCRAPDGIWQPGCVWVDEAVIEAAHDKHVLELPNYRVAA
jgi:hypothetical protein